MKVSGAKAAMKKNPGLYDNLKTQNPSRNVREDIEIGKYYCYSL